MLPWDSPSLWCKLQSDRLFEGVYLSIVGTVTYFVDSVMLSLSMNDLIHT